MPSGKNVLNLNAGGSRWTRWVLGRPILPTERGTDQILLGQLYRWRGSFEYEHESAVNTHGWRYVAGFAGAQVRPGSCKAAWSVPRTSLGEAV